VALEMQALTIDHPWRFAAYMPLILRRNLFQQPIPARDSSGDAVKFTVPTIVNAKSMVGAHTL